LIKPVNHRRLDKRLISPSLPKLFSFWPWKVKSWINRVYDEIGMDLDDGRGPGAVNMGFVGDKKKEKM